MALSPRSDRGGMLLVRVQELLQKQEEAEQAKAAKGKKGEKGESSKSGSKGGGKSGSKSGSKSVGALLALLHTLAPVPLFRRIPALPGAAPRPLTRLPSRAHAVQAAARTSTTRCRRSR